MPDTPIRILKIFSLLLCTVRSDRDFESGIPIIQIVCVYVCVCLIVAMSKNMADLCFVLSTQL